MSEPRQICRHCGTAHDGRLVLPGSGWIEFILYFAYLFPGFIYSIWRRNKRKPTCMQCGSRELVPVTSPVGAKLAAENYPTGLPLLAVAPPPSQADKMVHNLTKWLLLGLLFVVVAAILAGVIAVATRR